MKRTTTALTLATLAIILSTASCITSCSGDDGAPGPTGKDGTNGPNGTNGTTGAGFDEAISKGNIVIILDGTRPDGIAFKDTLDFRFAPSELYYSNLDRNLAETDLFNHTRIGRYLNWDGNGQQWDEDPSNTVISELSMQYTEANKLVYKDLYVELDNVSIKFPRENKYFNLQFVTSGTATYDENGQVTDANGPLFNWTINEYQQVIAKDGKLKYRITFTVGSKDNSSNHDLQVILIADAILTETMPYSRVAANHEPTAPIQKAEMLPLN